MKSSVSTENKESLERAKRKVREGVVVSNKAAKTVTIRVERRMRHPLLEKAITRSKKYYAHVEGDVMPIGTRVRIVETRPLSKLKRWRVIEVLS